MSNKAESEFASPVLYGAGLGLLAVIVSVGLQFASVDEPAFDAEPAPIDRSYHALTNPGPQTFALTAEDIDLWIDSTSLFKADRSIDSRNADSFSGGESLMVFHDKGRLQFFTGPRGRVWRIRQWSGKRSSCGSKDAGLAAAVEMASRFALVDLSPEQVNGIKQALDEDTFFEANLGIATLGIAGSCVDGITLTAL